MISQAFAQAIIENLVLFATDLLLPTMLVMFFAGISLKGLVYFTVKRMEWFAHEFDKRVNADLEALDRTREYSFFIKTKQLLEKTYYEAFNMRRMMKRRNPDHITSLTDRLFLVQHGCARFVDDTLKRIRHLDRKRDVDMLEVSKTIMSRNVYFNNVMGLFSANAANQILQILPGMFIVGGIFGTFLGIMKALPELGGMDLNDIEGTKAIMDGFLLKISFSMSTSILGIVLSVLMTFVNAVFSPQKVYYNAVNRMNDTLSILWDFSDNNKLPADIPSYQDQLSDLEILAEKSLSNEIKRQKGTDSYGTSIPSSTKVDIPPAPALEVEANNEEEEEIKEAS
jgi:hypothetical protein